MFTKPWQLSPENALQKSMRGAPDEDGGTVYDAIIVVDDSLKKGEPGHEQIVYANRGELRAAVLDAEQRGDVHVLPSDASLIDSGRIRKALIEALYPGHDWSNGSGDDISKAERNADGTPIQKSGADRRTIAEVQRAHQIWASEKSRPGHELRAAAAELDALVSRMNRE